MLRFLICLYCLKTKILIMPIKTCRKKSASYVQLSYRNKMPYLLILLHWFIISSKLVDLFSLLQAPWIWHELQYQSVLYSSLLESHRAKLPLCLHEYHCVCQLICMIRQAEFTYFHCKTVNKRTFLTATVGLNTGIGKSRHFPEPTNMFESWFGFMLCK